MLSAEHSTEVAEENKHDGFVGPRVTEAVLLAIDTLELDISKQCGVHALILSRIRGDGFAGAEPTLWAGHVGATNANVCA